MQELGTRTPRSCTRLVTGKSAGQRSYWLLNLALWDQGTPPVARAVPVALGTWPASIAAQPAARDGSATTGGPPGHQASHDSGRPRFILVVDELVDSRHPQALSGVHPQELRVLQILGEVVPVRAPGSRQRCPLRLLADATRRADATCARASAPCRCSEGSLVP